MLRVLFQSYTGKELFRILIDNKIKPIVLIAFTNHALDHMLNSILDAGITERIVRLGSRSTDERIAGYSLMNLERKNSSMNRQTRRENDAKKNIEDEIRNVVKDIQIPEPSKHQIKEYLQKNWGEHLSIMYEPPFWIAEYAARLWESEGEEGEWTVQGKKGKGKKPTHLMDHTYYGLWKRGLDIAFILPPQPRFAPVELSKKQKRKQGGQNAQPSVVVIPPTQQQQEQYQERMFGFFSGLGFGDSIPPVPVGNRPFAQLQESPDVWSMSLDERKRLAEHWEEEMRRLAYHNYLGKYKWLRNRYEEACERYDAVCDEVSVYSLSFFEYHPLTFNRGGVICCKMSI